MVIGRIGHNGPKPRKDPVGIRNKLPEIWVARQKRPKYKNEKRKAVRRSALHLGISSIFVSGPGSLSKVFRFIFLAPVRGLLSYPLLDVDLLAADWLDGLNLCHPRHPRPIF